MDEKNVRLSVPAEAAFARPVRMMAASLAAGCDMSVEDVEDVRMIAEEGFVYACATGATTVDATFELSSCSMAMCFSLGPDAPSGDSIELVNVLLSAVCDDSEVVSCEGGELLRLVKRSGSSHDE